MEDLQAQFLQLSDRLSTEAKENSKKIDRLSSALEHLVNEESFRLSSPPRPDIRRASDFFDQKVTVTQKVPEFLHSLKALDTAAVFEFLRQARLYRASYAVTLHVQSSVAPEVLAQLLMREPIHCIESIHELSFDQFSTLLWKLVGPRNQEVFIRDFKTLTNLYVDGKLFSRGALDTAKFRSLYENVNLAISAAKEVFTALRDSAESSSAIPLVKPSRLQPQASLIEAFETILGSFLKGMLYQWDQRRLAPSATTNFLEYLKACQAVNQEIFDSLKPAEKFLLYVSQYNSSQTAISKTFSPKAAIQHLDDCEEHLHDVPESDSHYFQHLETELDEEAEAEDLHGVTMAHTKHPPRVMQRAKQEHCFTKYNTGRCNIPDCRRDHSTSAMQGIVDDCLRKAQRLGLNTRGAHVTEVQVRKPERISSMSSNDLSAVRKSLESVAPVYRNGVATLGNRDIPMNVLLDSGATHESYINSDTVDVLMKHSPCPLLEHLDTPSSVTLADGVTKYVIDTRVTLPLSLLGDNGVSHQANLSFKVMPLQGKLDAIIGLPHLCGPFFELFLDVLTANKVRLEQRALSAFVQQVSLLPPEFDSGKYTVIEKVWETSLEQNTAPEDYSIPCFGESLSFVASRTFDEHREAFLTSMESMFPEEFRESSKQPIPSCVMEFKRYLHDYGFRAFQPSEQGWTGIKDVVVNIDWKEPLPKSLPCKSRPVPKLLAKPLDDYISNLRKYFWVESDSLILTPLVIAPKATEPFIRIVGAYNHTVNRHMALPSWNIPNAREVIQNLAGANYFGNADVTRAFHQLTLSLESSKALTVCTPHGNFRPLGVPEGVIGGSHYLQQVMSTILRECDAFNIVLYDNLFFHAPTLEQFLLNFRRILDLCIENRVILNASKTSFSRSEVIFGMRVSPGHYEFDPARLEGIRNIAFPTNSKEVRSMLGTLNFMADFVPRYADLAAPLFDMSKAHFSWDASTWTRDFRRDFELLKYACTDTLVRLAFPDYSKRWITYSDASNVAVCGIIVMLDEKERQLPLAIYSRKLSEVATRWSVIQKEAFALYNTYKCGRNLLLGKEHACMTDHANLLSIEKSTRPMLQNVVAFLQQFAITSILHIPGPSNPSDGLTRAPFVSEDDMHLSNLHVPVAFNPCDPAILHTIRQDLLQLGSSSAATDDAINMLIMSSTTIFASYDDVTLSSARKEAEDAVNYLSNIIPQEEWNYTLKNVHSARVGHWGYKKTKSLLDEYYPGHAIPDNIIQRFLLGCSICQKHHRTVQPAVIPLTKTHNYFPPDVAKHRYIASIDFLKLPTTSRGNVGLSVFINHFSKRVKLYPQLSNSAPELAVSLLSFYANSGAFTYLLSDLGSDLMGQTFQIFREYLGKENQLLVHLNTLPYRPMAHGTEPANKKIVNRLRDLINDPSFHYEWDDRVTLALLEIIINFNRNSEINAIPIAIDSGDPEIYFNVPNSLEDLPESKTAEFSKMVQRRYNHLRQLVALNHDKALSRKSAKNNSETNKRLNPGEFVLHCDHKPSNKLSLPRKGPFEVISHDENTNTVIVRSLIDGVNFPVYSGNLSRFVGDRQQAIEAAKLDNKSLQIIRINGYQGDINKRSTINLHVTFVDGHEDWVPYCLEFTQTEAYNVFANLHTEFYMLDGLSKDRKMSLSRLKKTPINLTSGTVCYVNLRSWSEDWFAGLTFKGYEDKYKFQFMVKGVYGNQCGTLNNTRIEISFPVLCENFTGSSAVDHPFVKLYGSNFKFKQPWILVDERFVFENQCIIDPTKLQLVLSKLKKVLGV